MEWIQTHQYFLEPFRPPLLWNLTFDKSGRRRLVGGCPLHRRVRPQPAKEGKDGFRRHSRDR